jgi:hypothetical protein
MPLPLRRIRADAGYQFKFLAWHSCFKQSRYTAVRCQRTSPSGQVRYPSHSWGVFAQDPSLDVGIAGEALAEVVRSAWFESGDPGVNRRGGPDADRQAKLLIFLAVEGSVS